jgi:hypothetical protein
MIKTRPIYKKHPSFCKADFPPPCFTVRDKYDKKRQSLGTCTSVDLSKEKRKVKRMNTKNQQMPADDLNARIGVLTRREVEARILAPLIDAFGESFGGEPVMAVLEKTIVDIARRQGAELAGLMQGSTIDHFVKSLQFWSMDNALEIELLEQNEAALSFNVTRCRYAEMYRKLGIPELGATLSCARDFALIEGFNKDIELTRTQTIMTGAPFCDFRYRVLK